MPTRNAQRASPQPFVIARRAAIGGLLAFAVHTVVPDPGRRVAELFDHGVYVALLWLAVAACLARVVLVRRDRGAWFAFTFAAASWAAGDTYYTFALTGTANPPFPSLADAGYLAFYPPACVGLVLLVRKLVRPVPTELWLDGVMAGLATATFGAAVLLQRVLETTEGSFATVVTNLAYPAGDVVLLALVVGVMTTVVRPGRTWALAGSGFAALAVADGIFLFEASTGSYAEGTLLDALWPAGLLLLADAAWRPDETPTVDGARRPLLFLPAASTVVALAVLVQDHFRPENILSLALAVATLCAVLARTALAFRENALILDRLASDAKTDAVTGLGNRRRLVGDLERTLDHLPADEPWLLALFDLDGFKDYNDTFGHPAGDALLWRLSARLAAAAPQGGFAYRLGGDEFCLLAPIDPSHAGAVMELASQALVEDGDGFYVTASAGSALLPQEAATPSDALRVADRRLYAMKHGKQARRNRPHEVLLQALQEREPELRGHLEDVARLARAVATDLGLPADELDDVYRAGQLHDVGKIAIPEAVLQKAGPLDEREWELIGQHTITGERILSASPALRRVGEIVRASHERWDGKGYPDGLAGESIPLAARIIAACDAFDAMTSDRAYRRALSIADALAELRLCASSQFDPRVVEALCARFENPGTRVASHDALELPRAL